MAETRSQPGRVLAGRYRLEEHLGEGGMGAIWRAEHLVLAAPVAVKIIDRDVTEDEQAVARFMREAQAAATLRSPHVVQILDYGVDNGTPFIAMELLEGENLAQRIKRAGRLGAEETARIVTHIARAVGRAHEAGIIHRDLKPENVFLVHNEDEEIAKVLDFGVAKVESTTLGMGSEGARTRTGSLLGTPYYMSPEQAQGNKDVDHRSDLWSLAVIAFECLTGRRPFYSDGLGDLVIQICVRDIPVPSELAPVPLGFDKWFARAVEREPERRFQSARELTDALREALGVEARGGITTYPEIEVSTTPSRTGREHDTEPMNEPPAASGTPLPAGSRSSGGRTTTPAVDQSAATLYADPPSTMVLSEHGALAAGPGGADVAPQRSGGGAAVVIVAAGFLLVGAFGGMMLYNRFVAHAEDPNDRPLPHVSASDDPQGEVPGEAGASQSAGRTKSSAQGGEPSAVPGRSASIDAGAPPAASAAIPAAIPPVAPDAGAHVPAPGAVPIPAVPTVPPGPAAGTDAGH
jgi:serine/threonine-protein kinase